MKNRSEGRTSLGLLLQGYWDENVNGRWRCGLAGGAPSSDFANFGDDDIFGFGRVEGEGAPEYVVVVKVSIGVEDSAMSERLFKERPADEIGAGI